MIRARRILRVLRMERAELSLSLVADAEMRVLNREYRGKDRPTDVLAFPLYEPPIPARAASLGDVVISIETAALEAEERGITLAACLDELVIHGILHLLGYDHEISPAEERRMARRARAVQAAVGAWRPRPVARPRPRARTRVVGGKAAGARKATKRKSARPRRRS